MKCNLREPRNDRQLRVHTEAYKRYQREADELNRDIREAVSYIGISISAHPEKGLFGRAKTLLYLNEAFLKLESIRSGIEVTHRCNLKELKMRSGERLTDDERKECEQCEFFSHGERKDGRKSND